MTEYEEEICRQLGIKVEPRNTPHPFVKKIVRNGTTMNAYFVYGMYRTINDMCEVYDVPYKAMKARILRHPNNPEEWLKPFTEIDKYFYNGQYLSTRKIAPMLNTSNSQLRRMIRQKGWEYTKNHYENKLKQNTK